MLGKKDKLKTSKLSSTVLDYYYKYGQNRDLEKYLRLKRQSTSKSSSDSSLKNYAGGDSTCDSRRLTKSMEKLNISGRKDDSEDRPTKSTENVSKNNRDESKPKPSACDNKPIKIEKKTQQQWSGKSKSKSYNFNLESSIEINLPATSSMPTLPTVQTFIDSISKPTQTLQLESIETQTDPFYVRSAIPSTSVEQTPPPTKLAVEKQSDRIKATQENIPDTSPASSVASAKVRLEWDSMADIGYNRIIDFKSQSNTNLTTFERSALTKFFAKRGLNFDDNLVILAPADSKSPLQKREFTQSAIEMRDAQKIKKELPKLSPSTNKQVWQRALVKYREKYGKSKAESNSGIDSTQFMAPHHSTPLPGDLSSSYQISDEHPNQSSEIANEIIPPKENVQRFEKYCQTSSIDVEAIGIQVEQPQIRRMSKSVQIEIEQVNESTQKDDEDLTIATSFEFLAPSAYKNHRSIEQQTSPPPMLPSIKATDDVIPKRELIENESIYIQEQNPDEKENIPPIDEKENIPPLHTMHRNNQPSAFKTPDNTIEKPAEQSMLPNDLQKGVDLINALIDSRSTDGETKKKLIRKIVRHLLKSRDTKDITQMIKSFSDRSNSKISGVSILSELDKSDQSKRDKTEKDTISGISTLSTSSSNVSNATEPNQMPETLVSHHSDKVETRSNDAKTQEKFIDESNKNQENTNEEVKEKKKDEKQQTEIREWLLPATQSEIDKENARKMQSLQRTDTMHDVQPKMHYQHIERVKSGDRSPKNSDIFTFLENEKKTHFNWIDQEIEHLKNLKLLMHKLNSSESNDSKGDISDEKINSVYAKHRNYLTIYENFRRVRKPMIGHGSQADVSSTLIDSSKSSDDSSRFLSHGKNGSKSHWIHRTTLESPPSTISSGSKLKNNSREPMNQLKNANKLPEWDSHSNMQQLVKNRTKLKTPNSDESMEAYAKACRARFERKCAKPENSGHNKKVLNKNSAREQPIYTKPYSSDSYSDVQNQQRSKKDSLKDKQSECADAYTSVTESDGFLSPNSISIGVAANSTSNTTTHQYDTKISVGLQTTNTLERMPIIQVKKPYELPPEPASHDQPTVRVNKLTINKQLQVRPESLAYIIVFDEDQHADENANSKGQDSGHINSDRSSISNGDRNKLHKSNEKCKRSNVIEQATQFRHRTNSNSSSGTSVENPTLQEYLQTRRPDFYANAEQRRKCLNDLHNLRQQRNEQRKKLLAMNIGTNAKMLNRNMKRLLPPPPLAQMRIFKSREIINQTRRKYQKLPEILQRQQMERDMKIRRNHRILVNVFSKNLQKHVLSGRTDLSNSMMIN